jgi:hypothetical protein
MNVGQILETHLGWAARTLGFQAITPVFDGASEEAIREQLKKAGLPVYGKVSLFERPHRRAVRSEGHGRLPLHDEAAPSRRRQGPRPRDRTLPR